MFGRRILVVVPHPDDEVVGCCGALERARAHNAELLAAYLTTGVPDPGGPFPWQKAKPALREARVERRRQEARRAAEFLHITPLGFQDVAARRLKEFLPQTRRRLGEWIREQEITTLWVPAYEGGHQDHDVANFLGSTLREQAEVWEFSEYNFAGGRVRSQEFPMANGSEQEILLDSEELERKRQALAAYASERANLRHIRGEWFWHREIFRPLARYNYSRPPHPGKLFYERFQWVPLHPRIDYCRPDQVSRAMESFANSLRSGS